MLNADKEAYINILKSVSGLCDKAAETQNAELRAAVLTKCQEAAIAMGENLESISNTIDRKAIEELEIIRGLEEFCEDVYRYSTKEQDSETLVSMKSGLGEIAASICKIPKTFRVAFLPYKASMWDSLESIWRCFSTDERCETTVVPIPYFEANRKTGEWEARYEGNMYPPDVPVVSFETYSLADKRPDLVFVHNPFDDINYVSTVHPAYYSEEIKKYCGKLAYVPYYVNPGFLSDKYKQLPLLYRSDYLILQSDDMKESCKECSFYDRVLPFGSPKFDKVLRLYQEGAAPPPEWDLEGMAGKKWLLLNTTITDFLQYGEDLMKKLYSFFDAVKKDDRVVIVWRPHPLLEGTIKAMRPQFIEKYQELVDYFLAHRVGVFDRTGDSALAAAVTDAYIGSDYSAMIGLYEVCGKPVFRFDSGRIYERDEIEALGGANRRRAKAEDVFHMNGAMDFFGADESEEYLFEDFVDDLANERLDEVRRMQLEAEAGLANNLDGTCGQKVYEYIMGELAKEG